jgi:tight adherence protein B
MDIQSGFAGVGLVAAFIAGSLLCVQAAMRLRRARHVAQSLRMPGGPDATERSALLRNGIPAFVPMAEWLLRVGAVRRYVGLLQGSCRQRGWESSDTALVTLGMGIALALAVVGALTGTFALAGVLFAAGLAVLGAVARQQGDAERERVRDAVPGALRSMSASFRAGYTLLQTFRQIAGESEGRLAACFESAAAGLETGKTTDRVLEELRRDTALPELGFVVAALEVQHRTGGSLQPIIDAACDAVNEELALRRALRVQTAQARLSARVVTAMPFVLLGVLSIMTQDFLAPFFASATGLAVLGVALGMQVAGVAAVRRLLEVNDE